MAIILASYFQEENHGPGRKIGITHDKPPSLNDLSYSCDLTYEALAPDREDMIGYYVARNVIKKEAGGWNFNDEQKERFAEVGKKFNEAYRAKLERFVSAVLEKAEELKERPEDLVGLESGDTLLSLEKGGNKSFRAITAEYLRKLGYEVDER